MALGDADETVKINFVVNTQQAVADSIKLRSEINQIIVDLAKLTSSVKGAKIDDAVKGMLKSFKEAKFTEIFGGKDFQDALANSMMLNKSALKEKLNEYNTAVKEYYAKLQTAAKEYAANEKGINAAVQAEKKAGLQEDIRLSKLSAQERVNAAKAVAAQEKAVITDIEAAERKNAQIQRQLDQQRVKESEKLSAQRANAWKREAQDILKAEKATGGFTNAIKSLGGALQVALGLSVVSILTKVIGLFQQGIENGVEFANQIYRLGASTRALQRAGLDITLQEVTQQVENLRRQFGFFSQKEAVQGVATIQLLSRSFDPTIEQMDQMTQAAVALSVVTGKDFAETSRELALFLSSGYAEAMQRAGLAVNRLRVAEEAQTMGIEKGYTALTEQERFVAGLSLVWKELAPILEEVEGYQKSLAGQIDTTTAEIETQTDAIALLLAPTKLELEKTKLALLNFFLDVSDWSDTFSATVTKNVIGPFLAASRAIYLYIDSLKRGVPMSMEEFRDEMIKQANELNKAVDDELSAKRKIRTDVYEQAGKDAIGAFGKGAKDALEEEKILDALDDVLEDLVDLAKDTEDDFKDAFSDYLTDVGTISGGDLDAIMGRWNDFFSSTQDLTVDQVEAMQDQWEGFFGEFGEIVDEGLDKAWEIWRDYYAKLADIDQKEAQDILDAQRDLQYDIQDLNRDTQEKLEDAARKYREAELKAERDYQEKLRRLREEFLFDLEDALRERDALQVLRLIRRYNLDKEQLERQGDLEAEERAENYRREIEDIRRQAARKLEELQLENARRIQEIRENAAREREEAAIERDQAIQELKEDLERERQERELAYEQEKEDIRKRFEEQLAEITKGLLEELGVTQENLDLIAGIFSKVFGEDGDIAKTYDVFAAEMGNMDKVIESSVSMAQQQLELLAQLSEAAAARISAAAITAAQAAATVTSSLSAMQQVNQPPTIPGWNDAGAHAFGGSVYANTPTMALFGEVPEIATFTPLSRMNTSSVSPVSGGGQGGNMKVQIILSPGLEAQIIDNSLGSMAEILKDSLGVR